MSPKPVSTDRGSTKMNMYSAVFWLSTLFVFAGCERSEDPPTSEREEICESMCSLVACDGTVDPAQIGTCADRCVEKWSKAEDQSDSCSTAYEQSVECFTTLECTEYQAWSMGDEMICRSPLDAFEAECPGMRFDFRS